MKNIILTIALISICFTGLAQRKLLAGTTVRHPKTENQITKEDSLSDEFGNEYFEREFQGVEEDTAFLNQDMRERETLKKGKITDPEREINTFDYEKIIFTDLKDFEKAEKEEKEKEKAIRESKPAVKPKK
jgi:hypothetical protein